MKATIISAAWKLAIVILICCMMVPVRAMAYTDHPGGTIAADETWGAGTHFVSGTITVLDGIRLTIQAGAVVKFAAGVQLTVYGTLSAPGTATESVVFTSRDDDAYGEMVSGSDGVPAPGDWYGINLYGLNTYDGIGEFDYCIIRYGGNLTGAPDANVFFNYSDSGHFANSISEYSARDGIRIANCSPQITASTFRSNGYNGLYAAGSGSPTIADNTFTDNGNYAAHLDQTTISPSIAGNTGSGNRINGLVFEGNVAADQTWASTPGFPIVLRSTVTVYDDVRLTIAAGTVVKLSGYQLTVYGTLDVNGVEDSPVVFTSLKDDEYDGDTNGDGDDTLPAPGDWYGINLYGLNDYEGIGEFDYCLLRFGGNLTGAADANVFFNYSDASHFANSISEYSSRHGIQIANCSPQITASTFRSNGFNGLYAAGSGSPTIVDNTFTDNGNYAAHLDQTTISPLIAGNTGSGNRINGLVFEGNVAADQTWASTPGFPIVLRSTVTVYDDVRLTIAAGTVVKLSGYQLTVYGTLDVNGVEDSPVVFTSLKDDEYDGDTNGDGDDTLPAPGDWYGINLYGLNAYEGIGEFDHCIIRYGGNLTGAPDANVFFNYSDAGHFVNGIIDFSSRDGIRIANCSLQICNGTLSNNSRYGIYTSVADPWIINSIVWGNTAGGISGDATVSYSDIQGGYPGEGNIDADPLFIDPTGDYRLDSCSPAIDAGDPVELLFSDYLAGQLTLDVDRVTAVIPEDIIWISDDVNMESDEVVGTTATSITAADGFVNDYTVAVRTYLYTSTSDFSAEPGPNGRRINMGAHGGGENAAMTLVCRPDTDGGDGDVDGADLALFSATYGSEAGDANYLADTDFNTNGYVDRDDLYTLAQAFGRTDCLVCR